MEFLKKLKAGKSFKNNQCKWSVHTYGWFSAFVSMFESIQGILSEI